MTRVIANLAMSVDGFVADRADGCDDLFGWYFDGDVPIRSFGGMEFRLSAPSAALFAAALREVGAFLVGRRLYDLTGGWNARPPAEAPMVVLTHDPPADWPRDGVAITFARDVASAVAEAKALAGPDRVVSVAGAAAGRACLEAGLLDEVVVNLVPVVLGAGVPWFAGATGGPYRFEDPEVTVAPGVTHLRYRVRRM